MAKARSPNRDKAFKIWQQSGGKARLIDIAAELEISQALVRKWKNIDSWDDKLNGNVTNEKPKINGNVTIEKSESNGNLTHRDSKGKFKKGNTAAVGHGAPLRNTNAVKTGEHQTIWLDQLTPDEQVIYHTIGTDPLVQINEDIKLLTYRERNMLRYLNELKEQKKLVETKDVHIVKDVPVIVEVYDEATGESRKQKITKKEKVLVERTETTKMLISQILRIEEALTRVQEKKIKAIETKHRILLQSEAADTEMNDTDAYINTLQTSIARIWDNG